MVIRKIEKYPAQILKKIAEPVGEVTAEIAKLLDDMTDTMYDAPGVGLAAPQVCVSLRCLVLDVGSEEESDEQASRLYQLVNPEITHHEGEIDWEEGCLSIPEFTIKMKRWNNIRVKALDKFGKPMEFEAEGLFSVAIQHEMDHLDGKLLIDRVSPLKREMYVKEQKKKNLKDKEPSYL